MKKILLVCIAGLLTFVFTGVTFALDKENNNSGKLLFYDKEEHYVNGGVVKFSEDMTPSDVYEYLKSIGCEARTINYALNIWTFAFDENENAQKKLKEVAKDKRVEYVLPSFNTEFYKPKGAESFKDIPGNVLTRFNDDLNIENIQALLNKVGAVVESHMVDGFTAIRFDSSKYTNQEIIDFLIETGEVAWAESNRIIVISFGIKPQPKVELVAQVDLGDKIAQLKPDPSMSGPDIQMPKSFEQKAVEYLSGILDDKLSKIHLEWTASATPSNMISRFAKTCVYHPHRDVAMLKYKGKEYYVAKIETIPGSWELKQLDPGDILVGTATAIHDFYEANGDTANGVIFKNSRYENGSLVVNFLDLNMGVGLTATAKYDPSTGKWTIQVPTVPLPRDSGKYKEQESIVIKKPVLTPLGPGISADPYWHPGPIDPIPTIAIVKPALPIENKLLPMDATDEICQRKAIEAQIRLEKNGKNYTISPRMADAPIKAIPIHRKQ